jgi:type II secretory pathway pseudopilin PulG
MKLKRSPQNERQRRARVGQSLLELVIAIALSGFLITMLSGMLAQTMSFSNTTQNDLIAEATVEELVDNARLLPYSALTIMPATDVPVNAISGTELYPSFRPLPAQLSFVDTSTSWTQSTNFLKDSTATETISDASGLTGIAGSYQITIALTYPAQTGKKTITRSVFAYPNGGQF